MAAVIVMAAVAKVAFAAAITVTEVELITELAVTVKVAVLLPAATVTEAGVVRDVLSSDRVTEVPPAGATSASVTVQVAEAGPVIDWGPQIRDETLTLAFGLGAKLTEVVLELPFHAAVTIAV